MELKLTHWFYILRDLADTHPDLLKMFEGFTVGVIGMNRIKFKNGETTSNSSTD